MFKLSLSLLASLLVVDDALDADSDLSLTTPLELTAAELLVVLVLLVAVLLDVEPLAVLELEAALDELADDVLVESVMVPAVVVALSEPIFGFAMVISLPLAVDVNPNLVKST